MLNTEELLSDGTVSEAVYESVYGTIYGIDKFYTYDNNNRLSSLIEKDRAGNAIKEIEYIYDNNGNQIKVKKTINSNIKYDNFSYDKLNRLVEITKDSNGKAYNNTIGINLIARSDSNKTNYYLYNGHADVVLMVDENGLRKNIYNYDAFGNIIKQIEKGINNPYRYAEYYYDEETDYYYLRARYYAPSIGRFISEDSIRGNINDPLSLQLYTYAHNNPVRYNDPDGHWVYIVVGALIGGVVNTAITAVSDYLDDGEFNAGIGIASDLGAKKFMKTSLGQKLKAKADDLVGSITKGTRKISTLYGDALQKFSDDALNVKNYIDEGGDLYRGGKFGCSNTTGAQFWAPESPYIPGYGDKYGVDFDELDYIIGEKLKEGQPFITRPAQGLGNNTGGAIEAVTNSNAVKLDFFHMP